MPGPRRRLRRAPKRPGPAIGAAAARAVDRVLSSREAFALMIRRLEEAGWHVEREANAVAGVAGSDPDLTPPARAR